MVRISAVVQEAVEDRDGLDFVAEQFGPSRHALVRGDDHRERV